MKKLFIAVAVLAGLSTAHAANPSPSAYDRLQDIKLNSNTQFNDYQQTKIVKNENDIRDLQNNTSRQFDQINQYVKSIDQARADSDTNNGQAIIDLQRDQNRQDNQFNQYKSVTDNKIGDLQNTDKDIYNKIDALQKNKPKDGVDGKDGINGKDGKDGINGRDGVDGKNGIDGKNGADGKDGLNGRDGKDGKDGAVGAKGDKGDTGVAGKDGVNGIDGKNGVDGKDGADGKDGVNGVDGKDGVNGVNGKDGAKGDTGAAGANGLDGKDGQNGKDADMTVVNNAIDTVTQSTSKQIQQEAQQRKVATDRALSESKAYTDSKFNQVNSQYRSLKNEVENNKQRADAGIAGALAASQIPQVSQGRSFSVGAGAGSYGDQQAIAVGVSARFNDRVVTKLAVTGDTQQNFGAGIGASYEW